MYKFIYKYKYNARQLTDVLRASFIFGDLKNLRKGVEIIHNTWATWGNGGILNIKDRIANPTSAGYRDVLINAQLGEVMVELQLHLRELYDKKKESHTIYKQARHFGTMFDKICFQ